MLFLSSLLDPAEENCINAIVCLRDTLGIPVTKRTIKTRLKTHPDYPSFVSISDTLNEWNVENMSVMVPKDRLASLPTPFIVQVIRKKVPWFVVVSKVEGDWLEISNALLDRWEKIRIEDFNKEWRGVVMLTDAMEGAGERDFKENKKKELLHKGAIAGLLFLIAGVCLAAIGSTFLQYGRNAWAPISLFLLKLTGVYIGALLLWFEVDGDNPILQEVCKGGKTTDCNKVLKSPAARIGGIVSWSELGAMYFAGGSLTLLLSRSHPQALALLSWFTLAASPVIIFSLYYQWRIARQWCRLCVTIQCILLLELLVCLVAGLPGTIGPGIITPYTWLLVFLCFTVPPLIWILLKPVLSLSRESSGHKHEIARIKSNAQVFELLLNKQKRVEHNPQGLGILLGNPDAKNKIIKVCNPYCGPCAKSHPIVEELISEHSDLQVQVIFATGKDERDRSVLPVKHFLALAEKNDPVLLQEALDDWYNSTDKQYEGFAARYKLNGELKLQQEKIQAMHDWCQKTEISFTPTFFINGHQLPEMYTVKDLHYLLAQ